MPVIVEVIDFNGQAAQEAVIGMFYPVQGTTDPEYPFRVSAFTLVSNGVRRKILDSGGEIKPPEESSRPAVETTTFCVSEEPLRVGE